MKNINKYADLSAYTADTNRPTTESTVSAIVENKVINFGGVNVIVEKAGAEVGDICVFDKNTLTVRYVKFASFKTPLPTNLVVGGVVYYRTTNKVHVVAKDHTGSEQWAAPYQVKLSGFDLSAGGTFTITVNSTTTGDIIYLSTDTLANIATKIMAALTAAGFTAALGWSVTAGVDYIVVKLNKHTPVVSTFTIADGNDKVKVAILTGNYQGYLSGLLTVSLQAFRKDGSVTSNAGTNFRRYLEYYEVSGTEDIGITVGATNTIKRIFFNSTDNAALFNYYGTYENYIADKMFKYPYSKGTIIDDNGKSNTDKLAAVIYNNALGVSSPAYPAAKNANSYGIATAGFTTGFEVGKWWLPSSPDMLKLISQITWGLTGVTAGNEDVINRALTLISGMRINLTSFYICSSEAANYACWIYSGAFGVLIENNKINDGVVRPVTSF